MATHKNLIFFNKEGDSLNFQYDSTLERYTGDILFHESASDIFKTYGIYTLERIPAFDYELTGELTLDKFQLFNEHGLHMYGSKYTNQQIMILNSTLSGYMEISSNRSSQ